VEHREVGGADPETVSQFGSKLRSLVALMRAGGLPLDTVRAELLAEADELTC
jgi:hypothetical protein